MELHYDWNDGWQFAAQFDPAIVRPACPELALEQVRLPHTIRVMPYNYGSDDACQGLVGYRRVFFAPREWEGRAVLLTFGGVAHDATVFCNGRRLFHHACGYTAFTVDLSSALRLGEENVVAVRCDSREDLDVPPFGGQLEELCYGGIWRAVSLDIKEPAYLRDVFIEAKAEGDFRIYTATVGETVGCALQAEIQSPAGRKAVYGGELSLPITGTLNGVHPWSLERPVLYTLTVRLIRPGTGGLPDRVLDEKSTRFGFRTIQFVAGGLYLNGERVSLRGLDRVQSFAYQGYAMPDSLHRLDAVLLKKELGCNAVRTGRCPPSPAFLDACDEVGLLAYVEMPGWQSIGGDEWKAQALQNCREMVCQLRNHPSVFLWGVRVTGSADDESFYKRTNEAVRRLDPTRPTAGTRSTRKSQLLEDVYAYEDTSYRGRGVACEARANVTPDTRRGYLIASYGGAQFPAKSFDDEPHRLAHALRCAAVLNDAIAQPGVAGSFGWCMTDYNAHRAFGSGDGMCYYGVMDAFRNTKLAAAVYASQRSPRAASDVVLEVSSTMAQGDHPGGMAGACWVFTNAESVRLFRDNDPVAEFAPDRRGRFAALPHPPIEMNDFVGALLEKYEGVDGAVASQVAAILNEMRRDALELSPLSRARMLSLRLSWNDLLRMYYKYIGVLGGPAHTYRFEAVWHGRVVRTVIKEPVRSVRLECTVLNPVLTDGPTWDCAAVRLRAIDQNGNLLPYCGEAVCLETEGPVRVIGPHVVPLRGGMAGTYLATTGEVGHAVLRCRMEGALDTAAEVVVRRREN